MSRNKGDQRGGHRRRWNGIYSCGCCEIRIPRHRARNRIERERESHRYEHRADQPKPDHQ